MRFASRPMTPASSPEKRKAEHPLGSPALRCAPSVPVPVGTYWFLAHLGHCSSIKKSLNFLDRVPVDTHWYHPITDCKTSMHRFESDRRLQFPNKDKGFSDPSKWRLFPGRGNGIYFCCAQRLSNMRVSRVLVIFRFTIVKSLVAHLKTSPPRSPVKVWLDDMFVPLPSTILGITHVPSAVL